MGEREGGRGIGRRFALTVAVRLSLRAMPLHKCKRVNRAAFASAVVPARARTLLSHKRKRVNRAAFAVAGYGSDAGGGAAERRFCHAAVRKTRLYNRKKLPQRNMKERALRD